MNILKYFIFTIILFLQSLSAQNFWQQTNGPHAGATVNDFLLYSDSIIFIATKEGIIKTCDNGENWERISGNYTTWQCNCITKNKLGVLYAGMRNVDNNSKKLIKSTDQGNSWQGISTSFDADIRYIFIPYRDTILLGTWDMGTIRSFNAGVTWNIVNNGNIYNSIYEIIELDDGSILAGSAGGGVYKTTNWGDLWIASNSGITPDPQGYWFASSFLEESSGNIYTGTSTGIYYSTNYGESWISKSAGLNNYTRALSLVMDCANILYAGIDMGNGVYYSTNGGEYWYHLGLNLTTNALGWDSDSMLYAGVSSSGLYRFVIEDSTWIQAYNQGYTPVEVNDLCLSKSGNLLASTEWWGLQYSSNNGDLWRRTNYHGYGPTAIESIDDSIFIAADPYNLYVSTNFGNWWSATAGFGVSSSESIYYDSITELLFVGTTTTDTNICNLYSSSDFGFNWELIHSFPVIATLQWINSIYVTKTNHNFLVNIRYSYWPTYNSYSRFFKSSDNGQTWELIVEEHIVYQIIEDNSSDLYAIASNGLMVSTDEGATWILRNVSNPNHIAVDNSDRIYNGLTYSTDDGTNWISMPITGLNNTGVNDLVINQNNRIYLANSSGVFYGEADSIVVSVEKSKPLNTFYLSQNYPNPFNPYTKIKFTIPSVETLHASSLQMVTLKVYDILGKEVAILVNEEKQPGTYEIEFTGTNLPSGIYFYQLKVGNYIETRKMVLLK